MLLRLYYIFKKSPRKCREHSDLIDDLKEVFEFPEGGNLPVRAHGSRWITYKRKALQRVVDRYRAYLNHLATLTEDTSIKSTDKQRLKGYLLKWREARLIIGSALYTDAIYKKNHLGSAVNIRTSSMISRRCLNSLKVVTYLSELTEVAGLHTSGRLYRELLIDTGLTYLNHLATLTAKETNLSESS